MGVVGLDAGWKLFNEGTSLIDGVVVFVTLQTVLVVRVIRIGLTLIEDDTFYSMSILKKGASHGCGHDTHAHCESIESRASSKDISSSCPVCMHKKSEKSRNRSYLGGNCPVRKSSSRHSKREGTTNAVGRRDNHDPMDSSYGTPQISRYDLLTTPQKNHGLSQIENLPPLRLAPPAVYHEKVGKGNAFLAGESSSIVAKTDTLTGSTVHLKELRVKGSSIQFPLKSSIFVRERTNKG